MKKLSKNQGRKADPVSLAPLETEDAIKALLAIPAQPKAAKKPKKGKPIRRKRVKRG